MKNFGIFCLKWGGSMYKLWMYARANIRKTKSVSVTLAVMFVVAAFLLNAGLLVSINYGSFFEQLKKELSPADVYYMLSDSLYTDEVNAYIDGNEHVEKVQKNTALCVGAEIKSKDKMQSYTILFQNMDETREMSKWKFVGKHLPAEEMSVYVPDIFKAVSGYQLDDKIELKYHDEETDEQKTLTFTVKGYTEDIFFSSTDTGMMGFYLPANTYEKVANILEHPNHKAHLIFMNLDHIDNVNEVESGTRDILQLNSSSLMAGDASSMFVAIDIGLIELSRCMMATMISVMMVLFAVIIVIVCLLVVRFRIVNNIEDDMTKIGSLKSIGYTSKQIILSILLQYGLISGIGSIIGIALSYPAMPAVSTVFEQQSGLKWEQGLDVKISLIAFAAMLLIIAAVVLLAARRVKTLTPIHALRGETTARKYKKNHLQLEKAKGYLPIVLAFKTVLQNIKQSIMIAVIVIAVTFAGAYGVVMYYNTTVDTTAFASVPGMEICNAIAALNPQKNQEEAVDTIKNMEHVQKVQFLDEVKVKIDKMEVAAFVMEDYSKRETVLVYKGRYPEKKNEITLAGILAERLHKSIGDKVMVSFGDQEKTFEVVGLSNGSSMGGLNVSILTEDFKWLNPDFRPQSLYIYLDKETDAANFIETLKNRIDKETLLGTTNFDKAMEEGMASYQNIVAMMGIIMLAITLTVVFLVLYFVISSSIVRRKRELGIQKAIGFTTFQLMNQLAIGFAIPTIIGASLGSFLGAVYTNPMMSATMKGMGIMKASFIVNPVWIIMFGAGTIVFSYVLSLFITWRIRKISAYALVTE